MKQLKKLEKSIEEFTDYFAMRYFDVAIYHWMGDEIGGCVEINDFFFNLTNMVDYVKYDYSFDEMYKYYYYAMECSQQNETPINIKNWKYFNK